MRLNTFHVDGEAKDQDWIVTNRTWLEDEMKKHMRERGYIPALDLDIALSWSYVSDRDVFTYRMSCKGRRVGSKRSRKYFGLLTKEGVLLTLDGKAEAA